MAKEKRTGITSALRARITTGLQSAVLKPGQRLPGVRELAVEFRADPRVVALAYRTLAQEGLVAIRPRSGAFVAEAAGGGTVVDAPSSSWLADVLAQGICRGIPARRLPEWFESAVNAQRIRAVVLTTIRDQVDGLARELRDDFGIDATGSLLGSLDRGERLPRAISQAHFLMTTPANETRVKRFAARLRKPLIVVSVHANLLSVEWRSLMRAPVYVIVADPQFAKIVREFVSGADGADNVRVLVAGRDDVSVIPAGAPTYVTEGARERLGRIRLPSRVIAPGRILSDDCVTEVMHLVVDLNLATIHRRGPKPRTRR